VGQPPDVHFSPCMTCAGQVPSHLPLAINGPFQHQRIDQQQQAEGHRAWREIDADHQFPDLLAACFAIGGRASSSGTLPLALRSTTATRGMNAGFGSDRKKVMIGRKSGDARRGEIGNGLGLGRTENDATLCGRGRVSNCCGPEQMGCHWQGQNGQNATENPIGPMVSLLPVIPDHFRPSCGNIAGMQSHPKLAFEDFRA
jgi:hypothetical protein